MRVEFYDKNPDLIAEKELQGYFQHRKTQISAPQPPCASAAGASSSFPSTSPGFDFIFIYRAWLITPTAEANQGAARFVLLTVPVVCRV
jgi:hypothetical protein